MAEIKYVPKKEVKEYKYEMMEALAATSRGLKNNKKKGFCQGLVGSAKRNLVLRKGNSLYDVDIQIYITGNNIEASYREDILEELKKHLSEEWSYSQSTSVITARLNNEKSFDLALIKNTADGKKISILNKTDEADSWIWNDVPDSKAYGERLKKIKGLDWTNVREEYKNLRANQWDLSKEEKKPSFALYVETINNVYNNKK